MTVQKKIPRHVAIIMDGNGRWAKKRLMPRIAGHSAGAETVRKVIQACIDKKIEVLTLFAFSSENWKRPEKEVNRLMDLFSIVLTRDSKKLDKQNARLKVIGDRTAFSSKLQEKIVNAEKLTEKNSGLTVVVAANYGGRWDILNAVRQIAEQASEGEISASDIDHKMLESRLALYEYPEPDLFIRTGGEKRISNFLLWQLAYTELYFTETLWPAFSEAEFNEALDCFSSRQRRFGRTSEQVEQEQQC